MEKIDRINLPEPRFEHLFRMVLETGEVYKTGTLTIVPVIGGTFEGKRLSGTIVSGGGDWNTSVDGANQIDGKYILKTDDGALITLNVLGWEISGKRQAHLSFTTGSKKYTWLSEMIIIAESSQDRAGKPCLDAFVVL